MTATLPTTSRSSLRRPAEPSFALEQRIPSCSVRLRLTGELDLAAVAVVDAGFRQAREQAGGRVIVLDLAEVELLSSAAAQTLIEHQQDHGDRGGRVVVQHVPQHVDRYLNSVGLDAVFEILDPAAPAFIPRGSEAAQQRCPVTLIVEGPVSSWTVATLRRQLRTALGCGAEPIGVRLGSAVVPSGDATVMLAATLRGLAELHAPLVITGAPPALALALEICAGSLEQPDRLEGHRDNHRNGELHG